MRLRVVAGAMPSLQYPDSFHPDFTWIRIAFELNHFGVQSTQRGLHQRIEQTVCGTSATSVHFQPATMLNELPPPRPEIIDHDSLHRWMGPYALW